MISDHQAPRAIKSPSPWFFSARATKRALAVYTITIDRVYDSKACLFTARINKKNKRRHITQKDRRDKAAGSLEINLAEQRITAQTLHY